MPDIVLCTINARYVHPSLGLRCLYAHLGALRERAAICEFHLKHTVDAIVADILSENPAIVGIGLYIWNVDKLTEVLRQLRAARPDLILVAGGPEASYEYETTEWFPFVDYVVCGEGEQTFAALAASLLEGRRPPDKVVSQSTTLDLDDIAAKSSLTSDFAALPYPLYSDDDCANKMVYVETSRGCPFRCAFCLSALEPRVREFPVERVLDAVSTLIERGARRFKFVDRTFNLRRERVQFILAFFRTHLRENMQVHFEIVPDRLDDEVIDALAQFPPGTIRLEIGIQSTNPETLAAIDRPQDNALALRNLQQLRERTGAIIHADLVAGLPYETCETFASAFDQVLATRPHEIQVGILKRLRGAPINRLIEPCRLVFAERAPYEIIETHRIERDRLDRIKRFARYFEIYHNTGNFPRALPLLLRTHASPFDAFMAFSDALWQQTGRTHAIPLVEQARFLHAYLCEKGLTDAEKLADIIESDFRRIPGRRDKLF